MDMMGITLVIFACIGLAGFILNIIGTSTQNPTLCQYATWGSSAASGFLIGLGFLVLFNQAYVVAKADYEKINKPAEKVYVNRCWTILGKDYCGQFHYENEMFKMDCDETGRCDIGLNIKE